MWQMAITGEFNDENSPNFIDTLIEKPDGSEGVIWFESVGGDVYAGMTMAGIIKQKGLHVRGMVAGMCSSSAITPFAACEERYVSPYATFLFHPCKWESDWLSKHEIREWSKYCEQHEHNLNMLIAEYFNCDIKLIEEWSYPGRYVYGSDLVKLNLAQYMRFV